jgi:hypothetical protein
MPLSTKLARIIEVAAREEGIIELPRGSHSNRSPRIDEYRPEWRRSELFAADKKAGRIVSAEAWCAWFATWCWHEALLMHPFDRQIGGCFELARSAYARGRWFDLGATRGSGVLVGPYPGAVFVRLEKPFEKGQSEGHTGIITGVSENGWTVSTIEGNSGDGVRAGKRDLTDPLIRGLALPLGLDPSVEDWPRGLLSSADLASLGTR